MGKISLRSIVQSVDDLPSLPHIATRVMELTEDPNSTAQNINDVLNSDPSMTAKVLKLANSAFYGFARRISTVTDATVLLGFQTIRSIVIAASINPMMTRKMEGYGFPAGEFWQHSQITALTSRMISRHVRFPNIELAYTAGLLHDVGKLVLDSYLKESRPEVIEAVHSNNFFFYEAERAVLGFNHALVGSRIMDNWNLPQDLVSAITWHHEPKRSKGDQRLAALVNVSDYLCLMRGIGMGTDRGNIQVSPDALVLLGFTETDLQDWSDRLDSLILEQDLELQ